VSNTPRTPYRRSISTAGVILVFLGVALYGFTQTTTFRSYLRAQVLDLLTTEVRADVQLGEIRGNLLTGFSVDGVSAHVDGRPVLQADAFEVRYNPLFLLVDVPRFRRITLVRPRIHLWRSSEGIWNLQQLLPPASQDSSSGSSTLRIDRLEILEGDVSIIDSVALLAQALSTTPGDTAGFNFHRLFLHALTLRAGLRLDPELMQASIREFTFISSEPTFELKMLRGDCEVRPNAVNIQGLSVETGGSSLNISASLRDVNLLAMESLAQLADCPVDVTMRADPLDLRELRQFLPEPLFFLDRSVGLDVEATGRFGRLQVDRLNLRMPRTGISLEGTLTNLHRPADLELDVRSTEAVLHGGDALDHLPGLNLPDLTAFGTVQVSFSFIGLPLNFRAQADGMSERGSFEVYAALDLREGHFIYDADVRTREFDLSGFSPDPSLQSKLNLHGVISGQGTDPQTMSAVARVEIDSSQLLGIPWRQSVIIADAADATARIHMYLAPHASRLEASGEITFDGAGRLPSYTFDGTVSSLNLSDFINSDRFASDLSFALNGSGQGFTFDDLQATVEMHFLPSFFGSESFENHVLRTTYAAHDPLGRHLTITSTPLDFEVYGTLTPPEFISSTVSAFTGVAENILARLEGNAPATALDEQGLGLEAVAPDSATPTTQRSKFVARIRDLYPLGVLANRPLRGSGSLGGVLTMQGNQLSVSASAYIPELLSDIESTVFYGRRVSADVTVNGVRHPTGTSVLNAAFQGEVEHALVNGVPWDKVGLHGMMQADSLVFGLGATYDSLLTTRLEGTALLRDSSVSVVLPYAELGVPSLLLRNPEPVQFTVSPHSVQVQSLVLANDAEELKATGTFGIDSLSQFSVSVRSFLLSNLHRFSRDEDFVAATRDLGGIVTLNASFSGSFDNPSYTADVSAQGVRIRESVLGQVIGRGRYGNGVADLFVELRSTPDDLTKDPDLLIAGTLPLDTPQDAPATAQPINLVVRSKSFNLQYLDPLFPHVTNLSGTARCNMEIHGTLDEPHYSGYLTITDARFLFLPLDLEYVLDGSLVPRGNEILIDNLRLRNIPERENNGITFSGAVALSGIAVKGFDITATGELQLMGRGSRASIESLYGDLTAMTSRQGIRWRGEPDQSAATGEVFLKRTSLTLPPSRSDVLDREQRISIVFVDDTSASRRVERSERYLFRPDEAMADSEDLLLLARARAETDTSESTEQRETFLDKVVYNLTVETLERSTFTIIIDRFTNERLVAYLDGRLTFQKDRDQTRLIGEVQVGEGSFYHYIRQFDATGKLTFTGDPTNPELDITATYQDFRASQSAISVGDTTTTQLKDYRVTITMRLQGDRREPRVSLDLQRTTPDGRTEPSYDPQGDAISYLISGKFKDELTPQERSSLLTTSLAGIGSSILSGPLTDLMRRELGFISSVDVLYYGGNIKEQTDIRLSGKVGDAVIQFGGRVFSDIGNANVNIQLPMSSVLGSESWRNFVFELSRQTDPFETSEQRSEPTNSAKLIYRITF
jgi:hypothetical protein